jgi:hypothetical protein
MAGQVNRRRGRDPTDLLGCHRFQGRTVGKGFAPFHLDEHKRITLSADEIDFPLGDPVIAFHDLVPLEPKVNGGDGFAPAAFPMRAQPNTSQTLSPRRREETPKKETIKNKDFFGFKTKDKAMTSISHRYMECIGWTKKRIYIFGIKIL